MLGHKTLRCTNTATSSKEMNQGETMSSVTNCLNKLCLTLVQLVYTLTTLKIILLYVQGCEKRKLKHIITNWSKNRSKIMFFINLDRYPICRAAVEPRCWNNSLSSIDGQLSSFNDRHFSNLNLGQTCMVSTLDLETKFLEVLNTSQIYPNTSKIHFVKRLAYYIKQ